LNPKSDSELIKRCLAVHPQASPAFEQLYELHARSVLMFLYGLHRHDEHAARDALQETFLRFWTSLPSFDTGRAVRPWLLRIARNASLDMWKRASAKAELSVGGSSDLPGSAPGPGPYELAAQRETAGVLRRVVLDLPTEQRSVFLLKNDQGLTYTQVADAVGCSVRTAKYRMKAALAQIGREAERLGVRV
jgi:RNA polymerase sigma-70 factor (ECF subfamily)